ncbi:hypothetical protein [Mucilaginibacter jinjuensis]|uniref:Lipocalin-like protein n=1 Tax=Mucilaginibacter jinjuensis TaxID=1176721 RepID=A0ABY7TAC6_9SPHI|nr:hypothetical protein [Mucilaginibacter jinjuensis]WCT13134.1 hypothetical protein PQO05_04195 [Mucilaginibacter jinjuensis]
MKKSLIVFVLAGLVILGVNSCKKDDQSSLNHYLTVSPWTLASIQVYTYIGSSLIETDTLNTTCTLKQKFTFNGDQSCSYDNFICRDTTSKGQWQFSDDKLTLQSNMVCHDTTNVGRRDTIDMPFKNSQIINLGGYSLVLQTGDINAYFTSTTKRVIKRWSFIHQD